MKVLALGPKGIGPSAEAEGAAILPLDMLYTFPNLILFLLKKVRSLWRELLVVKPLNPPCK